MSKPEGGVNVEADRAIMAFVRESRRAAALPRVGAFTVLLNPATTLRYLNYAIPDDGAAPEAAEVAALVAAFRTADRMPRVEFLPSVAPALEARLTAQGWTVEDRLPLMTCTTESVRDLPAPDGVLIEAPVGDAALLEMAGLQHDIFEDPEPADGRTVTRLRDTLSRGGRALVARDAATGGMIGAAQTVPPAGGATEVVGVVVAPSHRRRGLAAATVSALARQCFGGGLATVFLEAAPGADGAYRNAGFLQTSSSVHISLESDAHA
jgi:ribosomal protein S18 acetylase RimI-like enzyme